MVGIGLLAIEKNDDALFAFAEEYMTADSIGSITKKNGDRALDRMSVERPIAVGLNPRFEQLNS
jgi:hypothetical protein